MLKKVIKYEDYNGVQREEAFYFNLTKAEIMEMELSTVGGLTGMITSIVEAKDTPAIIKTFKEIILYGTTDRFQSGGRFCKRHRSC